MFDIGTKIKKAWNILWNYKILWIFAFLLVFTGGGFSTGGSSGGGGTGYRWNADQRVQNSMLYPYWSENGPAWVTQTADWFNATIVPLFTPDRVVSTILWMVVILFAISVLIGLLLALIRYPVETSLIRLVDEYEASGTKRKFKEGWRMGWNKRAFRIWVIDLIIGAPGFVIFVGLATGFAILVTNTIHTGTYTQIPGMIGLMVLAGFLFLVLGVVMIFVRLWRQFVIRVAAIEDGSIGLSFKRGWEMMAHNFKNAFLTWLVMLGLNIAAGIGFFFVALVLIPVLVVLTIPGGIVAAIPASIAFGIASIFAAFPVNMIVAAIVALIFFGIVVGSPFTLVGGLYSLFSSSIWTQTYREMKSMNIPPALSQPETPPAIE